MNVYSNSVLKMYVIMQGNSSILKTSVHSFSTNNKYLELKKLAASSLGHLIGLPVEVFSGFQ